MSLTYLKNNYYEMKNPISVKDLLDFHINHMEELLRENINFEERSEITEWKMELFTSVIYIKTLLNDHYR